uniref:Uncharacterized protein n=1 Tax=Tetranychus urticae TaxID=32264 RepID=T1K7P3_TETUR
MKQKVNQKTGKTNWLPRQQTNNLFVSSYQWQCFIHFFCSTCVFNHWEGEEVEKISFLVDGQGKFNTLFTFNCCEIIMCNYLFLNTGKKYRINKNFDSNVKYMATGLIMVLPDLPRCLHHTYSFKPDWKPRSNHGAILWKTIFLNRSLYKFRHLIQLRSLMEGETDIQCTRYTHLMMHEYSVNPTKEVFLRYHGNFIYYYDDANTLNEEKPLMAYKLRTFG